MCRGARSAHGRASPALSVEAFPRDSADPPTAGPGRMCSTAPDRPRTTCPIPAAPALTTAFATATPRGRPRGADPGPSPITDSSEPAPRNPMMTGPKIPRIPGRPKNPSKTQCTYRCVVLPDLRPAV